MQKSKKAGEVCYKFIFLPLIGLTGAIIFNWVVRDGIPYTPLRYSLIAWAFLITLSYQNRNKIKEVLGFRIG